MLPHKLNKLKQYDDIKMKQLTIYIVPKNKLAGKLIDVSFTNVRAYFNRSEEQAKNEKHTRLGWNFFGDVKPRTLHILWRTVTVSSCSSGHRLEKKRADKLTTSSTNINNAYECWNRQSISCQYIIDLVICLFAFVLRALFVCWVLLLLCLYIGR